MLPRAVGALESELGLAELGRAGAAVAGGLVHTGAVLSCGGWYMDIGGPNGEPKPVGSGGRASSFRFSSRRREMGLIFNKLKNCKADFYFCIL